MAGRNCCKCVTVSLVPTASLILVIVFACGIILLPILYVELSNEYKVSIHRKISRFKRGQEMFCVFKFH